MIGALAAWRSSQTKIPFDMFDLERNADEARRSQKLRNIYHRGQDLAWDGRTMLADLVSKYGGIKIAEDKKQALGRVFEIILWGELAAWKISAELADALQPLEAKMAATSQAHDEARHFYVMHDYLKILGYTPKRIDPYSQKVLDITLNTPVLTHKILGMQLMIETIALTIFQTVRESRIEPVLADLLLYYEKDEARHVGLGTQYLPDLMRHQTPLEIAGTMAFQTKLIFWTLASLKAMQKDLATIGIVAPQLVAHGRARQLAVNAELWEEMRRPKMSELFEKALVGVEDALFLGGDSQQDLASRWRRFKRGYAKGMTAEVES